MQIFWRVAISAGLDTLHPVWTCKTCAGPLEGVGGVRGATCMHRYKRGEVVTALFFGFGFGEG